MHKLSFSMIVALVLAFFISADVYCAEREVKVEPVPPAPTELKPLDAEAKEHVEAKRKFLEQLEAEAKTFKMTIAAIQDPEVKKQKEQEFRESRKEKITKFLDDEKRREEMKKNVDQLQKKSGNRSS